MACDPVAVAKAFQDAGLKRPSSGAFESAAVNALARCRGDLSHGLRWCRWGADPFLSRGRADIIHLCLGSGGPPAGPADPRVPARGRRRRVRAAHRSCGTGKTPTAWQSCATADPSAYARTCRNWCIRIRAPKVWPVKTVAHRGVHSVAAENTLPAAACAFAAGIDWVDWMCAHPRMARGFVINDADVDGQRRAPRLVVGSAPGAAAPTSMPEAGSIRISPAAQLARLTEILAVARRSELRGIYIEIKHADPYGPFLREVQQAAMIERCFFWGWGLRGPPCDQGRGPQGRIMTRRMDFDRLEDCFLPIFQPTSSNMTDRLLVRHGRRARLWRRLMICYMGPRPGTSTA